MSWFGDGSIEQEILNEIEWQTQAKNMTHMQTIAMLAKIIEYYTNRRQP